jgi:hypothetical protein
MTLELSDPVSGTSLELVNGQTLRRDRQGSVDASPFTGDDSEDTYLTSLQNDGRVEVQGAATGLRLARSGNWDSDPLVAVGEFAATLDAFVNGAPGNGYTLSLDYRNQSVTGVPESVSWTARGGEPYEMGYSLVFLVGDAVGLSEPVLPDTETAGGDLVVNGTTVDTFREFQSEKQQPLNLARVAFADSPEDNVVTTEGGVTRTVTATGQVAGDATARNTFDDNLRATIGQDTIVTLEDPFTGRDYFGMMRSYESTDEAGLSRLGEFGLEFVEGTT